MAPALKVKLIQPSRYVDSGEVLKLRRMLFPSLRLPLLAALAPDDVEVVAQSEYFEPIDFDEPVDLVGITSATIQASRAYEIADEFRRRKVPVVMGGIHASMMPDEAAEHADTVIVGEAEETWPQFIADFKAGRAKERYVADERPTLRGLPVPDFSVFDLSRFILTGTRGVGRVLPKPFRPVQTARGCPHNCEFCSVTTLNGHRLRCRPIDEVIAEIRAQGLRGCLFTDDNIFASPERAKELLRALIALKVKWFSQAPIAAADDPELVRLARESGCWGLCLGIETLSPDTLRAIGKRHNVVDDYARQLRIFREAGISIVAAMIFGFDGEDPDVFDRAVDFLIRNRVPYTSWRTLSPYPGTALYERMREAGRLKDERWWLNRDLVSSLFRLKFTGLSMRESLFEERYYRAFKRFYSLGSIARRVVLPPQPRCLRKVVVNLAARRRVARHDGLTEI